jgi:hypothetical protein
METMYHCVAFIWCLKRLNDRLGEQWEEEALKIEQQAATMKIEYKLMWQQRS